MYVNRKHPRVKATLPIEIRPLNASPLYAQTADICVGGCYVEMMFTQPVATRVWVTIWIGEKKIIAMGEVVSSHPQVGNGMKFTSISPDDAEKLQQLVSSLLPTGRLLGQLPVHQH
jgi:c-di-GMP-binding flagellar brake protein YcgR